MSIPGTRDFHHGLLDISNDHNADSRPLLEFGGGSGEILRDLLHLRSVSEAEALISGAEDGDQMGHISMSRQMPEPLGRFSRTPAATRVA